MRTTIAIAYVTLLLTVAASADTYVVNAEGTGDYPTIQEAMNAALDGDVIELTNGTFTGPGNRDIDFLGKAVTVMSASGQPELCVIECEGLVADPHRGFIFQSGESSSSVLQGVTITHGVQSRGGAIFCGNQSGPSISECILSHSTSTNSSDGAGALWCDGSPHVADCRFEGNIAMRAGALFCTEYNSATFLDCEFINNEATVHGGAVYAYGIPTFYKCRFSGNHAGSDGGAVFGGPFNIDACTFAHNTAGAMGGALTFNTVGAYYFIHDCTFYSNACGDGGAIHIRSNGAATLWNIVIAFSTTGPAITCETGGQMSLNCCDLFGNAGGDWVGTIADQLGFNGNICEDPLFCNPEGGNLMLQGCSPCAPFSPPNPECDLIGAWPVGCGGTPTIRSTWGGVKALFLE